MSVFTAHIYLGQHYLPKWLNTKVVYPQTIMHFLLLYLKLGKY